MDQPLPANTQYYSRISLVLLHHILPSLEPDLLSVGVLATLKWHQLLEILYFACNVTPKQPLEGPKTGRELQELVLSRYYSQGARLRTCFNLGSRRSRAGACTLLLNNTEVDWTHGIGHFQLFEGLDRFTKVALLMMLLTDSHVAGRCCFRSTLTFLLLCKC